MKKREKKTLEERKLMEQLFKKLNNFKDWMKKASIEIKDPQERICDIARIQNKQESMRSKQRGNVYLKKKKDASFLPYNTGRLRKYSS